MYDIVLYFGEVRASHLSNYLSLNKQLNKKFNCLMLLDNGKFGVKQEQLCLFEKKDLKNVTLCTASQAVEALKEIKMKIFVTDCGKTAPYGAAIGAAKSHGAITVQVSKLYGDFYYHGADICSLVSPLMQEKFNLNFKNVIHSNCITYGYVEDCTPEYLSKEQFCKKYNLNSEKDIFVWLPDPIQSQTESAQKVYREICRLDNVVIKLHPNEYSRHKAERFNNKWSYELFSDGTSSVLDVMDTFWCYKYIDCAIGHQTSTGIEFSYYKKPFLYVDYEKTVLREHTKTFFSSTLDKFWVGHSCRLADLKNFISTEKYKIEDETLYNRQIEEYFINSSEHAVDILSKQIIKLLESKA
jgi:hypothetical protein